MQKLFTSEAVTSGHPDKMCDLISDSILDAYLKQDENSKVACEVAIANDLVLIMGEITSRATIDIEELVRNVICDIGYNNDSGFNGHKVPILVHLNKQSNDIALGVNQHNIGAGDQGIMYGYATNETENYMPLTHTIACALASRLEYVRKSNIIKGLKPDGKTQVTLNYESSKVTAHTIVISASHEENKNLHKLKEELIREVIKPVLKDYLTNDTKIIINPTGKFTICGPISDSGLTGRKICVDTYGGLAHHGGGAFSGKDYTKVDRSGAYYARYVAKNIIAAGLATKCEISVSYAIGLSSPIGISINTFKTNTIPETKILEIINTIFDFSPKNIIKELNLKNVKYTDTTLYSHFGKKNLPWEQINKVKEIKDKL